MLTWNLLELKLITFAANMQISLLVKDNNGNVCLFSVHTLELVACQALREDRSFSSFSPLLHQSLKHGQKQISSRFITYLGHSARSLWRHLKRTE